MCAACPLVLAWRGHNLTRAAPVGLAISPASPLKLGLVCLRRASLPASVEPSIWQGVRSQLPVGSLAQLLGCPLATPQVLDPWEQQQVPAEGPVVPGTKGHPHLTS